MQAKDWMSREPRAVRQHERLDAAARVMWEHDCGICPVVDAHGVLVGVVTDRDACMASYTQGKPLAEIPVATAMARVLRTCRAEDSVAVVLQAMQQGQVHRLPVVDARGALVGIVSTTDLVRAAATRPAAVDATTVVKALATISSPRAPAAAKPAPADAAVVGVPVVAAAPVPTAVAVAATATAAATAVASSAPLSAPATAKAVDASAKRPVAAAAAAKKPAAKTKVKGRKG